MKVLFICSANLNRSQIAEVIFNRLSKKNRAVSAGLRPRKSGNLVKLEHNNPFVPLRNEGYDISKAKVRKLNKSMADSSDKVVLILGRRELKDIPSYLRHRADLEFWEVGTISDHTSFDEYCRLERKRIRQIETHLRDLVAWIG